MKEYTVLDKNANNEELIIWGYSLVDACRRCGRKSEEFTVVMIDYID